MPLLYQDTCRTISTGVSTLNSCYPPPHTHTPPLLTCNQKSAKKRKTEKRQVTDLNSWLEAWNRYATCRIASDSAMALELIKYQTVVSLHDILHPWSLSMAAFSARRLLAIAQCVGTLQRKISTSGPLTQPNHVMGNNPPGGASSNLSFRDRVPISAHLGTPVKPNVHTIDIAMHTPSGKEICK